MQAHIHASTHAHKHTHAHTRTHTHQMLMKLDSWQIFSLSKPIHSLQAKKCHTAQAKSGEASRSSTISPGSSKTFCTTHACTFLSNIRPTMFRNYQNYFLRIRVHEVFIGSPSEFFFPSFMLNCDQHALLSSNHMKRRYMTPRNKLASDGEDLCRPVSENSLPSSSSILGSWETFYLSASSWPKQRRAFSVTVSALGMDSRLHFSCCPGRFFFSTYLLSQSSSAIHVAGLRAVLRSFVMERNINCRNDYMNSHANRQA